MTGPDPEASLSPARRGLARLSSHASAATAGRGYEDAELARGQAAAVLGALARMQLRVDVLAREQSDMFAKLSELLEAINSKLDAEVVTPGATLLPEYPVQ